MSTGWKTSTKRIPNWWIGRFRRDFGAKLKGFGWNPNKKREKCQVWGWRSRNQADFPQFHTSPPSPQGPKAILGPFGDFWAHIGPFLPFQAPVFSIFYLSEPKTAGFCPSSPELPISAQSGPIWGPAVTQQGVAVPRAQPVWGFLWGKNVRK